jgi:hypothetical protein
VFNPGPAIAGTPLGALAFGNVELQVYWRGLGGPIVFCSNTGSWGEATIIEPIGPGYKFAVLQWDSGKYIRLYYQRFDGTLVEYYSDDSGKTWVVGKFKSWSLLARLQKWDAVGRSVTPFEVRATLLNRNTKLALELFKTESAIYCVFRLGIVWRGRDELLKGKPPEVLLRTLGFNYRSPPFLFYMRPGCANSLEVPSGISHGEVWIGWRELYLLWNGRIFKVWGTVDEVCKREEREQTLRTTRYAGRMKTLPPVRRGRDVRATRVLSHVNEGK